MAVSGPTICGLIGFGALARQVVGCVSPDEANWIVLGRSKAAVSMPAHVHAANDRSALIAARPALVVEVASQQAVADHVPPILDEGIPVVLASTGVLADPATAARLAAARRSSGARLVIPPGSIGGLDYLEAIARLPDTAVRYTSRKPVAAWAAELAERSLDASSGEIVLFEGAPEEAALLYPKNLNAALTVAMAVEPARLTVRVVADPAARGNTHEIEATSAAGEAHFRFVNTPSPDNPKTSMVTALSLAATVRRILNEARGR